MGLADSSTTERVDAVVNERFARGGPVARKIGIVAVARRLVIDLWRYLDAGVVPEGAVFKDPPLATNGGAGE